MTSFESVCDLLLTGFEEGFVDEDEFLMLNVLNQSSNAEYPYTSYSRFNLKENNEVECKTEFRVKKRDIPLLAEALRVPGTVKCSQGTTSEWSDREEALCILLKRFAYPCRYSDMIPTFGRSVPELAMINNTMIDLIHRSHSHRLTEWNHQILNPEALEMYARAISDKGAGLIICFGYVDETVRPKLQTREKSENWVQWS